MEQRRKRSSNWVRDLARERDNNTCQMCGKVWDGVGNPFPVHHLDGLCGKIKKGYDKIAILPRLITLCTHCHKLHPEYSHAAERLAREQRSRDMKKAYANGEEIIDISRRYNISYQIVVSAINDYTPPESAYAKLRREYREYLKSKKVEDRS